MDHQASESIERNYPVAGCSFFCPRPARMECASDDTWGAHRIRVEIPEPISGMAPGPNERSCQKNQIPGHLHWVELLSHRLNLQTGRPSIISKMCNEGLLRLAKNTAPHALADITSNYFLLASALNCPTSARSSFCWLGNSGPVGSQGVFGPADRIPHQMKDLSLFLDENAEGSSAWLIEAAAYQLYMIHPLSNGNGRTVRAIVIGFHRKRKCMEALYLFWRLKFSRRKMFDQWKIARQTGVLDNSKRDEFDAWRHRATALNCEFENLLTQGLPHQAITALCLHGEVSEQSVRACDRGLGRMTASRISQHWIEWLNHGGEQIIQNMDAIVQSTVNT